MRTAGSDLATRREVTSTSAHVCSGSFTAPFSSARRILLVLCNLCFPHHLKYLTSALLLLLGSAAPPSSASPPRQQHRLAAGLRAGAAAEQHGAASSCCSSCLPMPKPAEEALVGPCDSGPSHRRLFQLGHFRHRPVPALSASNCHGNESSPFY